MPMTKLYYIEGLTRKELFLDDILIAGMASIMTKAMLAPMERVHLNMVNQAELLKFGSIKTPSYSSAFDCALRIFRTEGLRSFWRGNLAGCIAHFPSPTLNLTFKDELKISFNSTPKDPTAYRLPKNMAAGGIAGMITLCFLYPVDSARSKLAFDIKTFKTSGLRQYDGLVDVYHKTIREKGVTGLYKGFTISCFGTIIYRSLYFGLYDTFKPVLLGDSPSLASSFALGYVVSVFAGLMSYPADTVKRKMAVTDAHGCPSVKYKSSWDCFKKVLIKEGPRALMVGGSTHFLRAIDGALFLMGFDELVYLIIEKHGSVFDKINEK